VKKNILVMEGLMKIIPQEIEPRNLKSSKSKEQIFLGRRARRTSNAFFYQSGRSPTKNSFYPYRNLGIHNFPILSNFDFFSYFFSQQKIL